MNKHSAIRPSSFEELKTWYGQFSHREGTTMNHNRFCPHFWYTGTSARCLCVTDDEAERTANELVGPPINSHVSRAYSCPVEPPTRDRRGCSR